MKTKATRAALSALAQESPFAVFRMLVQAGLEGMAASRIADQISASPSVLSFHLKELSHAQLVTPRNEGRLVIYSANFETMNGVIAFLTENCCGGNMCTPAGARRPARKKWPSECFLSMRQGFNPMPL